MKSKKKVKQRNPFAFILHSEVFKPRIVENKRLYSHKNKNKEIKDLLKQEDLLFLIN